MFSTDEKCLKEHWSVVSIQGDLRKQSMYSITSLCIVLPYISIEIKGVSVLFKLLSIVLREKLFAPYSFEESNLFLNFNTNSVPLTQCFSV